MNIPTIILYTSQIIVRVFNQVVVTMIIGCLNTLMAVIATVIGYGNILTTRTNRIQDCRHFHYQREILIWVNTTRDRPNCLPHIINKQIKKKTYEKIKSENNLWRRLDLNQRSSAYEADEITNFSTPLHESIYLHRLMDFFLIHINWLTIINYLYNKKIIEEMHFTFLKSFQVSLPAIFYKYNPLMDYFQFSFR